jgi:hypothetical protein
MLLYLYYDTYSIIIRIEIDIYSFGPYVLRKLLILDCLALIEKDGPKKSSITRSLKLQRY